MLIKVSNSATPASSEIATESVYLARRQIVQSLSLATIGLISNGAEAAVGVPSWLANHKKRPEFDLVDEKTTWADATTYNNYYEFGTAKTDPARNSGAFKPWPWQVEISGECERPGKIDLEAMLRLIPQEERVYRHRCVEAWSMVLPWVGFSLSQLLSRFLPTSRAKYVVFTTLYDKRRMPGQRYDSIDWPYQEALRIDEAMHPLAMLVTGLYGRLLPNQNGAPLRLIVPWKYGFKGIKAIVRIEFVESMPQTSWNTMQGLEYGFYGNVNPTVAHPRWSQTSERRIAGASNSLFKTERINTLMFNGYADAVAPLYAGMDLRVDY